MRTRQVVTGVIVVGAIALAAVTLTCARMPVTP
jgi:hypothetical protein